MGSTRTWGLITVVMMVAVIGVFAFRHSEIAGKKEHSVTLRWKPAPNATSYNIYRRTEAGKLARIGQSPSETYVDKPVPSGSVFYYGVSTMIGAEESRVSDLIRVEVPRD